MSSSSSSSQAEYTVRCHCGDVESKFRCNSQKITAWECNCSDCHMRGNVHFMVTDLDLPDQWLQKTILYEWGTKTAKRRFCKRCGILPFYTPRSNPDGYGVTLKCVDFGDEAGPEIQIKTFNGVHWEESYNSTKIAKETAK